MAELDFVLFADGATARPDGKLDIYGAGFNAIFAAKAPVQHPQLSVVIRVLMSVQEAESPHRLDLVLMSPDGPEIARAQADIEPVPDEVREQVPPGEKIGVGAVMNFSGLVFPSHGPYHLAVLWDSTELRQPLYLKLSPLAPPGMPGQTGPQGQQT